MAWPAHDAVDIEAAALRADQPLAPIEHRYVGAVSLGHFGQIGRGLMAAVLAHAIKTKCALAALPKVIGRPGSYLDLVARSTAAAAVH